MGAVVGLLLAEKELKMGCLLMPEKVYLAL